MLCRQRLMTATLGMPRQAHGLRVLCACSAAVTMRGIRQMSSAAATAAASARETSSRSSNNNNSTASKPAVTIDPTRLPNTIPGLSREELAARMERYYSEQMAVAAEAQPAERLAEETFAKDVEVMRRALPEKEFEQYMQRLEKTRAAEAVERAKRAAMSPAELHLYLQRQRRRKVHYEWYKTALLLFSIVGSLWIFTFLFFFFK